MRLAILADIHGNLPALEAVLKTLERIQPDYVAVNGDLINGVPFSAEVIDRLRATSWAIVRGNHEFYLLDHGTERAVPGSADTERWGQLHWLVASITPEQSAFLAMLPDERTFCFPNTQPLRMTHGLPGRNRVSLYRNQPEEKIAAELANVQEQTFVTAHTHIQIDRHVTWQMAAASHLTTHLHGDMQCIDQPERHWHVVNPGSVGLPLNRRTEAQFAVVESVDLSREAGGWRVTHYQVPYDRCAALDAFAARGMLEAGGIISRLFYWELVTAEVEIIYFYRWAYENGLDPDRNRLPDIFARYDAATGRSQYVRRRDPLYAAGAS